MSEATVTKATFTYLGRSSDKRTNRWCLSLPCGCSVKPRTTLFSRQIIDCDKHLKTYVADYNNETIEEAEGTTP